MRLIHYVEFKLENGKLTISNILRKASQYADYFRSKEYHEIKCTTRNWLGEAVILGEDLDLTLLKAYSGGPSSYEWNLERYSGGTKYLVNSGWKELDIYYSNKNFFNGEYLGYCEAIMIQIVSEYLKDISEGIMKNSKDQEFYNLIFKNFPDKFSFFLPKEKELEAHV